MASKKEQKRIKRKMHIRKKLRGNSEKPRVYIFRSNKYIYVGLSDDETGKVLASKRALKKIDSSEELGEKFGKEVLKKGIKNVVFDRSGYKYHGNVKSLAEGIRKSGLTM